MASFISAETSPLSAPAAYSFAPADFELPVPLAHRDSSCSTSSSATDLDDGGDDDASRHDEIVAPHLRSDAVREHARTISDDENYAP